MVRIRLRRVGAKKQPYYRVVVADSRSPRDGRHIEVIGHYNPRTEPETVEIQEDRALYWLGQGAQPSEVVHRFLEKQGTMARLTRLKAGESLEALVAEYQAAIEAQEIEPEVPVEPEVPEEPEVPVEPEAIEKVEEPEAKEAEPETPEEPEEPEVEEAEPEAPVEPEVHEEPEAEPEALAETKAPEVEAEPEAPAEDEAQEADEEEATADTE